jgi:hypothetical protein
VGLRNREYFFFNEQLTKDAYEKRLADFPLEQFETIATIKETMNPLIKKQPHRAVIGLNNEQVTGDYLFQCKNCKDCYDCTDLEDCRFCNSMRGGRDCYDISHWGHPAELCYECGGVGEGATHLLFCSCCWPNCHDLLYCNFCNSCNDCFGCVGLRHKSYCIFNTQYTQEEYERIVPAIIESMQEQREWGEYFRVTDSPYCYNESASQKYYPLTRDEVLKRGWTWKEADDQMPAVEKIIKASELPSSIKDIPDDILNWAITCEATGRPFKIVKQELDFYRTMRVPIPRIHPDERLRLLMGRRNPRKLWKRSCARCQAEIQTTYAPDRPETVFCEKCYLETVY